MSLALARSRGSALKKRLSVKGIQNADSFDSAMARPPFRPLCLPPRTVRCKRLPRQKPHRHRRYAEIEDRRRFAMEEGGRRIAFGLFFGGKGRAVRPYH